LKNNATISCDLLVIGSGIAGMVAAARAASLGLDTVLTGSSSGFFLTSGLLDFLGVYPVESSQVLESPFNGLDQLRKQNPDHPYSKIDNKTILESLDFTARILSSGGLEYSSAKNTNVNILTSAGTFKPSFLVPQTMIKGSSIGSGKKKILLADFKGLKGYSAALIAQALKRRHMDVTTVTIQVPQLTGDFNVMRMAALFEDDAFLHRTAKQIESSVQDREILGLPAVCGIHNSQDSMKKLENLTGLDCFEIPGLPPSIPGLRLKNAFETHILKNKVRVFNNVKVAFTAFENEQILFTTDGEPFRTQIAAKGVILASGRFPGRGLAAHREVIRETVFDIPVYHPQQRSLWYQLDFFSPQGHPVNRAGILTDSDFRPVDKTCQPLCENVYAAGSILAHNDWTRLKSGAGVSCVSAFCAVNHFHARKKIK